jgi:hypothetical protein
LARMRSFLKMGWKLVSTAADARLPVLSAAEQTKLSWASRIESYAAVPEVYKNFFEPLLADGRSFPYTVLTPSYERFIHRTTEKLICDFGGEIYTLERTGTSFEAQCYPVEGISYVEVRTMLLDSRIKISGIRRDGIPASTTLKFNSVTDHLLKPIVRRMRHVPGDSGGSVREAELEKFAGWARSSYKFMSYARRSLQGGEEVILAILQPEIRRFELKVIGMTYHKTIAPTHACILTDRELIMIREDERQTGEDKYGGIWDFIPLNKIEALSLNTKGNDLLVLSIQLVGDFYLESIFHVSMRKEIDQILRGVEANRAEN